MSNWNEKFLFCRLMINFAKIKNQIMEPKPSPSSFALLNWNEKFLLSWLMIRFAEIKNQIMEPKPNPSSFALCSHLNQVSQGKPKHQYFGIQQRWNLLIGKVIHGKMHSKILIPTQHHLVDLANQAKRIQDFTIRHKMDQSMLDWDEILGFY